MNDKIYEDGDIGSSLKRVMKFWTVRDKMNSVHEELKEEGVTKIEVADEGLEFHYWGNKLKLKKLFIIVTIQNNGRTTRPKSENWNITEPTIFEKANNVIYLLLHLFHYHIRIYSPMYNDKTF